MSLGLAAALIGLTVLATALLMVPLLRHRRAAEPSDAYNLMVYRDQLAEIDRDLGRGLLDAEAAAAARAEIGRRALALAPAAAPPPQPRSRRLFGVAAGAVLLVPVVAWLAYWQLGSPSLPDAPFAARPAHPLDMAQAAARLVAHLQQAPGDLRGWVLLARADLDLGRYDDAAAAYGRAARLSNRRADIVGDWGEAQVLAAHGTVTAGAKEAFEAALKDPNSAPRSRYYLALYQFQQGNPRAALQGWVDLAAGSPPDAAWLPLVHQRIIDTAKSLGIDPATLKTSSGKSFSAPAAREAGAGPSSAEVAAAERATAGATPAQRAAMIRGMVASLAAKLQQYPDDADGWARLGRAYSVLGEPDKAADAYGRAVKLRPGDTTLKDAYAKALAAAGK